MIARTRRQGIAWVLFTLVAPANGTAHAQDARPPAGADSVVIRIQNTDLRTAVQIVGQYLDRPVVFSGAGAAPVTLETPRPVPRRDILRMLRGLVESQNFELVDDSTSGLYRVRQNEPARAAVPPAPGGARPPTGGVELFLLPLQHARALDLATTINLLYGRGGVVGAAPSRPATLGEELRSTLLPPATVLSAPPAAQSLSGRPAALSGEMTVVADARANSLIIRASRGDYELIRDLVSQLDVRPLQVLIEVLIAEVRRDHSVGINVEGTLRNTTVGDQGAAASGSLGSTGLGDFALQVLGIGGKNVDAKLTLASSNGDVRILSRPVVLTANNEPASIVVGSQRPFVQLQRALPTDAAARDQVVQYRDVGTKLQVTPTISGDGSVQLDVTQEVSSATSETAFNAPVISTRSVQTRLMIRDGQTVALGGLTDRQKDVQQGGLPLLSSIPLIGGLFGHAKRQTAETELFVFLTPHVIRTDDDAMRLTAPMKARADKGRP